MTPALAGLAELLLANFVTLHLSRRETLWRTLDHDLRPETRLRRLRGVLRAESLIVQCHGLAIRHGLRTRGHDCFLERTELVGEGGWRIHLFALDHAVIRLLPEIIKETVGPGDPIHFDPNRFVERRLRQIEMLHRRTGRYEWQEDDLP
jgi:hypothetical protein